MVPLPAAVRRGFGLDRGGIANEGGGGIPVVGSSLLSGFVLEEEVSAAGMLMVQLLSEVPKGADSFPHFRVARNL